MIFRMLLLFLAGALLPLPVMAQEALVERARAAMAVKGADQESHGKLLATYADSLRTFDVVVATKCLEVAGIAAYRSNQLDSAMVWWQRGVDWASQAGEERSESSLLNALAIGYTIIGDVEGALPIYDRTLEVRETLADTVGLTRTWGNLATAYANMGRTAEALAATSEEAKWLAFVENPKGSIGNAMRKAQNLTSLGRLDEAVVESREAMDLAEQYDDDEIRGMAAMTYGNALLDMGDYQDSFRVLSLSLTLLRDSGNNYTSTFVEQSLINCLIMMDRFEEALARLEVVIPEVESAGQMPLLTVLQRYKGVVLFEMGRLEESEGILQAALADFEQRRESLKDDRSRAGVFASSGELYSALARCMLATGRTEEAFDTIERGRGAVFRDHASGKFATVEELKNELLKSNGALILFNDPVNEPLTAFVLDHSGLRTVDLGYPDSIIADARAASRLLAAGESLETCGPALRRLEESIAIPVLAVVDPKVERFSIVPPSFLAGFPLGVLKDSMGIRWSEIRPLSYLPNASSLIDLESRSAPQNGLLAFADPTVSDQISGRLPTSPARSMAGVPLPEARSEIAALKMNQAKLLMGRDATGDQLRKAMSSNLAVLHLATHAVVDPIDGGRSAVVLSGPEGVDEVTAQEISSYNFQGDLVVLSGCSTFGNHQVLGEGWFGLPRSFLAAGARSVISTLWDVDDLGARQFITVFYDALHRGAARDEALVEAREVCRQNGMPPRDWAAFVLTGVGHEGVALLVQPTRFPLFLLISVLTISLAGFISWILIRRRD